MSLENELMVESWIIEVFKHLGKFKTWFESVKGVVIIVLEWENESLLGGSYGRKMVQ